MAFTDDDIFSVMADEICRGRRFVMDANRTGTTVDDDLHFVGTNHKWLRGWKPSQPLDGTRRSKMRREVIGLMEGGSYYERNREKILEGYRQRRRDDPQWRADLLTRKREYRSNNREKVQAYADEYRNSGRKKENNKRQASRAKVIRGFIRSSLCDSCLQQLHQVLVCINELSKERKDDGTDSD